MLMQAIADELSIQNFTIKVVAKKIKTLRSTYYLELTKIEKSKASGGGTFCLQAISAMV